MLNTLYKTFKRGKSKDKLWQQTNLKPNTSSVFCSSSEKLEKRCKAVFAEDAVWISQGKHSCILWSANGHPGYSEEAAVQQLYLLFICFMELHDSDTDNRLFWQLFLLCAVGTQILLFFALHVSIAVCSAGRHLQGYRWGCWYKGPIVPNLDTPGHHPVSGTGSLSSSLIHKLCARDYGFIWPTI